MAGPTPESNLALIEELQTLVSADTYEMPEGPEFSYPAVGQAVDDEMWQYITLALGNGVLALPGHPYWLEEPDNANNTMKLKVSPTTGNAQAVLRGFYHRLLRDMTLSFPMPTQTTTYYVVLELNPLKAKSPAGPISVKVYPNELNTESGRQHLILWTVVRKPNQLMSDAVVTQRRPKIAPTLAVDSEDQLPPLDTVLWGTIVLIGGSQQPPEIVRAGGGDETGTPTVWVRVTDPEWYEPGDTATYEWVGHGYHRARRRVGNTMEFRGRIRKVDGTNFIPGGGSSRGYLFWTLSEGPEQEQRFITATSGLSGQSLAVVTVYRDGEVRALPLLSEASWISLDGIRVSMKE
ncbi:hypothetical protein ACSBQT_10965 [Brevibacterium sp. H602]